MADVAALRDRALALADQASGPEGVTDDEAERLAEQALVVAIDALAVLLGSLDRIADSLEMLAVSR